MHVVDGRSSPEFTRFLLGLASAFPTTGKLSAATIITYGTGLADYSVDEIRAACRRAIDDGTLTAYFPSLPEIRKLLAASAEDAAVLAWTTFRRAADDVGAWASVEVEDAAAGDALAAVFGTWATFCEAEEGPALAQRRAEFVVAYRDARRRTPRGAPPRRLPGLCESSGDYVRDARTVRGVLTTGGEIRTLPDVEPRLLLGGVTEPEP